jgi:hypothetical protein
MPGVMVVRHFPVPGVAWCCLARASAATQGMAGMAAAGGVGDLGPQLSAHAWWLSSVSCYERC